MLSYTQSRADEITRQIISLSEDKVESDANKLTVLEQISTELGNAITNNGGTWPPEPPP
jgi:hypothetical protein